MPDFDTLYPWNRRRRVALDSSGNVVGYHAADNTDNWADGTPVDWSAYESNGYNCMVQVPKFYYKQQKTTIWEFSISPVPKTGYALHPAFIDSNGYARDYYYISAFEGWVDADSKLRSLPYKQPSTSEDVTGTFTAFQGYASNGGVELMNWKKQLWAEQLQFYIEYADWNSQSIFTGITNLDSGSGNHSQNTGHTLSLGNGNVWKWVDGIECDLTDGVVTIGGTAYTLTDTTTNYIYPSNFEPDVPGFYPCTTGGGTSTYLTDYLWRTNANDRIPRFGGYWRSGASAGGLFLNLNNGASNSDRHIGARAAL